MSILQDVDEINKVFEIYAKKFEDGQPQAIHDNKDFIFKLYSWIMLAQNETQVQAAIQLAFIKGYEAANNEEPIDDIWREE
jgi:hypothetical protein